MLSCTVLLLLWRFDAAALISNYRQFAKIFAIVFVSLVSKQHPNAKIRDFFHCLSKTGYHLATELKPETNDKFFF